MDKSAPVTKVTSSNYLPELFLCTCKAHPSNTTTTRVVVIDHRQTDRETNQVSESFSKARK